MENITFLVAFSAGLLSFLSPCVLPLVPVYLASLVGPEVFEVKTKGVRIPIFLHSLCFVVGFTVVFIIMGAGAGLAGFAIGAHLSILRQISGTLMVVFGAWLLLSQKIARLNLEGRLTSSRATTTGYLRSFVTGAIFTLAWTPCVGPILAGILTLAASSEVAWQGANLLAFYSLGLGVPFLIIGGAFDAVAPLFRRIQRYSKIIYIVSGGLLIAVGILILANKLIWFSTLA